MRQLTPYDWAKEPDEKKPPAEQPAGEEKGNVTEVMTLL